MSIWLKFAQVIDALRSDTGVWSGFGLKCTFLNGVCPCKLIFGNARVLELHDL